MKFYTPEEIAKELRINKLTVYDLIRKGQLEAVKIGRIYRVSEEDFKKFIEEHKENSSGNGKRGRKPSLKFPV